MAKDIPQVEKFRKDTKDFTDFTKLTKEEVLYLNLCDWLEPQATALNQRLIARGGITLTDSTTGQKALIKQYDLVHSLLGEMAPGSIKNHTKGGHLFIAELKAATLELKGFKKLEHGFFDILVKRGSHRQPKTFYPLGTTAEEAVESLEKCIKNSRSITLELQTKNNKIKCLIKNEYGQNFTLYVDQSNIAEFHPSAI